VKKNNIELVSTCLTSDVKWHGMMGEDNAMWFCGKKTSTFYVGKNRSNDKKIDNNQPVWHCGIPKGDAKELESIFVSMCSMKKHQVIKNTKATSVNTLSVKKIDNNQPVWHGGAQ